jgi:NAD(P)-dependent dehydrogenase (short-subunit alcohol dehydrogenase family)
MRELSDRVAVVTGAASGIGKAMAVRFAAARMRVVLSDIENDALQETTAALKQAGADVLAVQADVSKLAEVQRLAALTLSQYGAVHVLCNNAGIFEGGGSPSWTTSADDWNWILGVNLMGVIHGQQTFLPIMIEQGSEAHIVNTASIGGFIAGNALYSVTKFGVVALSECLYAELKRAGSKTSVSVLCPGYVRTRLADSARNRPTDLSNASPANSAGAALRRYFAQAVEDGIDPAIVADHVMTAIVEDRFYVFTHPDSLPSIAEKTASLVAGENPKPRSYERPRAPDEREERARPPTAR